jgi:hypothetical protein
MPVSFEQEKAMQSICSITAVILALAGPGECKTSGDGVAAANGATNVRYLAGLPAQRPDFAFAMPRPVSPPRIPRPKWP